MVEGLVIWGKLFTYVRCAKRFALVKELKDKIGYMGGDGWIWVAFVTDDLQVIHGSGGMERLVKLKGKQIYETRALLLRYKEIKNVGV